VRTTLQSFVGMLWETAGADFQDQTSAAKFSCLSSTVGQTHCAIWFEFVGANEHVESHGAKACYIFALHFNGMWNADALW